MRVDVVGVGVLTDAITCLLGMVCTSTARLSAGLNGRLPVSRLVDSVAVVADPHFSEPEAISWLTTLRSEQRWEGQLVVVCGSSSQRERLGRLRIGDGSLGRSLDDLPGHAILGPPLRLVELLVELHELGVQAESWSAACRGPAALARAGEVLERLLSRALEDRWAPEELSILEAARTEIRDVGLVSLFPNHSDLETASHLLQGPIDLARPQAAVAMLVALRDLLARSPWNLGSRPPGRRARPSSVIASGANG